METIGLHFAKVCAFLLRHSVERSCGLVKFLKNVGCANEVRCDKLQSFALMWPV